MVEFAIVEASPTRKFKNRLTGETRSGEDLLVQIEAIQNSNLSSVDKEETSLDILSLWEDTR